MNASMTPEEKVKEAEAELAAAQAELAAKQEHLRAAAPTNPITYWERRRAGVYDQMAAERATELAAIEAAPAILPDPREHVPLGGDVELAEYIEEVDAGGGATPAIVRLTRTVLAAPGTFDVDAIDQSYADLLLGLMVRGTRTDVFDYLGMQFNGDTGNHYSTQFMDAGGAGVGSGEYPNQGSIVISNAVTAASGAADWFSSVRVVIPGYASSLWRKHAHGITAEGRGIGAYELAPIVTAGAWDDTSPITSIHLFGETTANLAAGSEMRVYGIL